MRATTMLAKDMVYKDIRANLTQLPLSGNFGETARWSGNDAVGRLPSGSYGDACQAREPRRMTDFLREKATSMRA